MSKKKYKPIAAPNFVKEGATMDDVKAALEKGQTHLGVTLLYNVLCSELGEAPVDEPKKATAKKTAAKKTAAKKQAAKVDNSDKES